MLQVVLLLRDLLETAPLVCHDTKPIILGVVYLK